MPDLIYRNLTKNIIKYVQPAVADHKKNKFVIYTNGMGGQVVRKYLETEFSIWPEYIIDNKVYDGINILNIEQAKKRDNSGVYFLICSWHGDYYEEIRKKIYDAFPREQIIDVFPRVDKALPTDEEICETLRYLNTYLERELCL